MLAFALPGFRSLVEGVERGRWTLGRFADGELHARLHVDVRDRACAIVGTLAPPDRRTLAVPLLAHTLRRAGARRVTAVLPYLGYARQDRAAPGTSLGLDWALTLLEACGVDDVVTLDIHNPDVPLPLPVRSRSAAALLAGALDPVDLADATVVAPDDGALRRARALADAAGIAPLVVLHKRRDAAGVVHSAASECPTRSAVIVDDILDTGATLISGCRWLRDAGTERITILVTHAVLSGTRWRELPALGVRRIVATDSLPGARRRGAGIVELLPAGPLVLGADP